MRAGQFADPLVVDEDVLPFVTTSTAEMLTHSPVYLSCAFVLFPSHLPVCFLTKQNTQQKNDNRSWLVEDTRFFFPILITYVEGIDGALIAHRISNRLLSPAPGRRAYCFFWGAIVLQLVLFWKHSCPFSFGGPRAHESNHVHGVGVNRNVCFFIVASHLLALLSFFPLFSLSDSYFSLPRSLSPSLSLYS